MVPKSHPLLNRPNSKYICNVNVNRNVRYLCIMVAVKTQILSSSFSSTLRLLKFFLFPGAYCID